MTRFAHLLAAALGVGIAVAGPAAQAQQRSNDPRVADLVKATTNAGYPSTRVAGATQ